MNLMIVDDEQLTREGIYNSVDWFSLGITSVTLAYDGIDGLSIAKTTAPDIILSDVRMPRMDGIEMSIQIRKLFPDCMIIFMSGYSDKEYLKSAIKLKAVNYVEKPIDIDEIKNSVSSSVSAVIKNRKRQKSEELNTSFSSAQLALDLIHPAPLSQLKQQFENLEIPLRRNSHFVSVAVSVWEKDLPHMEKYIQHISGFIHDFSCQEHCQILISPKGSDYIICHLIISEKASYNVVSAFCSRLLNVLKEATTVYIAAGKQVVAIEKIYQSHNDAAAILQSAFFMDASCIITQDMVGESYSINSNLYSDFKGSLKSSSASAANDIIISLVDNYKKHNGTLVSYVRDAYYRLLYILNETADEYYISIEKSAGGLSHTINECRNLKELHELLQNNVELFFSCLETQKQEKSIVSVIREYINSSISDSSLSIRTISDHTGLSVSYACTLYKNETGETLNQYITAARIEKAKQLIRDPRLKITDVSAAVGYADSNYFAKLFKKNTGYAPSEYRENYIND